MTSCPAQPASAPRHSRATAACSTTSPSRKRAAPSTCATPPPPRPPLRSPSRGWCATGHWMYKNAMLRGPSGFFRRPRGYVDYPQRGSHLPRGPAHILGWCLFPGTSVARVEVRLNGGPPERARVAMERGDIQQLTKEPAAPLAGFEYKVDLARLPATTASARIEAVAHGLDGRELRLEPVEFAIGPAEAPFEDEHGTAAALRARAKRPLRPHPAAGEEKPDRPLRLLAF